jgi:hypothetical protein
MVRFSEHAFDTNGTFKLHGIPVYLDSVVIHWESDEDGITAWANGAMKKSAKRGDRDIDDLGLLDDLNNENDSLIHELATQDADEYYDYVKEQKSMERDYWSSQFSSADMRSMRRGY